MIRAIHQAVFATVRTTLTIEKCREYERLAILKILDGMNAYTTNHELLSDLLELHGINNNRATLLANVAHLSDLGLVRTKLFSDLVIITLTLQGQEALRIPTSHKGLKPVQPACITKP